MHLGAGHIAAVQPDHALGAEKLDYMIQSQEFKEILADKVAKLYYSSTSMEAAERRHQ